MIFISIVILKEIIFTCVIYAVTVCGTDQKQQLAIITDHSSVYYNKMKEADGGGVGIFVDELIRSDI